MAQWYGELNYGDHYTIVDNGKILRIKVDSVDLVSNTALELYIYEQTDGVG